MNRSTNKSPSIFLARLGHHFGSWRGLLALCVALTLALIALRLATWPRAGDQAAFNGPHLVFDETEVDLGQVPLDQIIRHQFTYRNAGSATLVLTEAPTIVATEGC